jgi:UDP-N-acetylmuramate dehydrogenase
MNSFKLTSFGSIRNSFGVHSKSDQAIEIYEHTCLNTLFNNNLFEKEVIIIGEGYNTIPRSQHSQMFIKLMNKNIQIVSAQTSFTLIKVDAGVIWDDFVEYSVGNGLLGLENLSLIPGSVGAAPVHNIGAYGYEVSEFIESINCFDLKTGKFKIINNEASEFDYRTSTFKKNSDLLIISVVFKLFKSNKARAKHLNKSSPSIIKDFLLGIKLFVCAFSLQVKPAIKLKVSFDNVRDILKLNCIPASFKRKLVCYIRNRTLLNPKVIGNVGCFFKCPVVDKEQFEKLRLLYPDIEYFSHKKEKFKLSACWLIKNTGWAGVTKDNVTVDSNKPVILLNGGNATGEQVIKIANLITEEVQSKFNVELLPEAVLL